MKSFMTIVILLFIFFLICLVSNKNPIKENYDNLSLEERNQKRAEELEQERQSSNGIDFTEIQPNELTEEKLSQALEDKISDRDTNLKNIVDSYDDTKTFEKVDNVEKPQILGDKISGSNFDYNTKKSKLVSVSKDGLMGNSFPHSEDSTDIGIEPIALSDNMFGTKLGPSWNNENWSMEPINSSNLNNENAHYRCNRCHWYRTLKTVTQARGIH